MLVRCIGGPCDGWRVDESDPPAFTRVIYYYRSEAEFVPHFRSGEVYPSSFREVGAATYHRKARHLARGMLEYVYQWENNP